ADDRLVQVQIRGDRFAGEELVDERPPEHAERTHRAFIAATRPRARSSTLSSAVRAANTASSEGRASVVRRLATESWPTMCPSFRMTTREQTCSTTSRTCELNTTILPSAASA